MSTYDIQVLSRCFLSTLEPVIISKLMSKYFKSNQWKLKPMPPAQEMSTLPTRSLPPIVNFNILDIRTYLFM